MYIENYIFKRMLRVQNDAWDIRIRKTDQAEKSPSTTETSGIRRKGSPRRGYIHEIIKRYVDRIEYNREVPANVGARGRTVDNFPPVLNVTFRWGVT